MQRKYLLGLSARYILLLGIALFQSTIISRVITPLTLYPLLWILQLFTSAHLLPLTATIETPTLLFSLIPACIGGSAYYLLTILNLTTPMSFKQRLKSLLFLIGSFLVLNMIRILLFVMLFSEAVPFTSTLHMMTWYFVSIILVVGLWFYNVSLFKIISLPIISDFSILWYASKRKKGILAINSKKEKK